MVLIGDVKGKHVVIVDDMADTCGTLVKASESLKEMGAKSVRSIVTHGILSGPAKMRLFDAIEDGHLDEFICSNSLPIKGEVVLGQGKYFPVEAIVTQVNIGKQIAYAIKAIIEHKSVEDLKKH
jgi:ribose-phosphate pyrophosphokinase